VRTLILGMDGDIGWGLAMHLSKRGHIVSGVDNFARRANVESLESHSAIPILDMPERFSREYRLLHAGE
jgi:UDP-sulfoquinovose synthase